MDRPIVSARPKRSGFAARDLLWLTPLALVAVGFVAVVAWPVLLLLYLYLFLLDAWVQDRLLLTILVMSASAVLAFTVIRPHRPRGERFRPTAVALARAASWWQVLFLPLALEAFALHLGDNSPLLFGCLLTLPLQPVGTLLLRRTSFLLTGTALKAVALVPPSVALLLAAFPPQTPDPYGYPDGQFNATFFHLIGAGDVLLAASIAAATYLAHRAESGRGRA